ncbi:SRPBCC family protein [Nocardioides sp. TF02-7]|uniref:SRPBCC family protein n=1 Tax=Nocardioides sp. TF02-7 TaxID=2917724 RepID=UPI001F058665|nr:SRPBCC family protein [Nocardioides sp. TF02-7]UMG94198.1 SRPBCC family protein [Nocardioides sp. TF02-7]
MTATTPTPTDLLATTTIDAPRDRVWAMVSDLRRMASWSDQVVKTFVLGREVRRGTRFVNINHQGWKHWPTTAQVVRYAPPSDLAFRVVENRTVWSFRLEDAGDGRTRVVHRREAPDGVSALSRGLVGLALGGQDRFTAALQEGMTATLVRLKADAER